MASFNKTQIDLTSKQQAFDGIVAEIAADKLIKSKSAAKH
jgi:hypothetical protein